MSRSIVLGVAVGLTAPLAHAVSPPAQPTGFAASAASAFQVKLNWLASSDAAGYHIYKSATSATGSFSKIKTLGKNATSFIDSGAAPGQTFYYKVQAYNRKGKSPESSVAQIALPAAGSTSPDVPSDLSGTLGPASIELKWTDPSHGANAFILQRSKSADPATFVNVTPSCESSSQLCIKKGQNAYIDPKLSGKGFFYFYRLKNGTQYSNVASVQLTAPAAPTGLAAEVQMPELGAASVKLSWTRNSDNETATIIKRTFTPQDSPAIKISQVTTIKGAQTSYVDAKAHVPGIYYYQIVNHNPFGNSDPSNAATAIVRNDPGLPYMKLPGLNEYKVNVLGANNVKTTKKYRVISDLAVALLINKIYSQTMIANNAIPHFGSAVDPTAAPVKTCSTATLAADFGLAAKLEAKAWDAAFKQAWAYIAYMKNKFGAITFEELKAIRKAGMKSNGKFKHDMLFWIPANFSQNGGWFAVGKPDDAPDAIIPVIGQTVTALPSNAPNKMTGYTDKYFQVEMRKLLQSQGLDLKRAKLFGSLSAKTVTQWFSKSKTEGPESTVIAKAFGQNYFKQYWKKNYCPQ